MTDERSADVRGDRLLPEPDAERTETQRGPARHLPLPARIGGFTPGTMLGGRYRIVAPLGTGGAGEVYRAEDTKLGQTVALKFVAPRIAHASDLLDRIVAEVRIGRQVAHPNLCRIYDMGEVDDHYFITMEYVDGENLASLLHRVGRLPEDKAVQVAREICAGLAAAHDRGVVHRDVKPSNVMIDGRGRARITDFGLAIIPGEAAAESFAGTPAYMAPEQFDGVEATERSDIYSLGLVLYEIFTGKRVFTGSASEIALAHSQPKRPPSTIVRGLNPAVERVILRCLEEKPDDRPESVRDVLADLPGGDPLRAALEAGETPSPRAVAAAERVGQLPLRTAWSGAVAVVILVAAIVAMTRYTMVYRQSPLSMSPAVLVERARNIIRAAGYEPRGSGWRTWFGNDLDVLKVAASLTPALDRAPAFHALSPVRFGYRESPLPLIPQGRGAMIGPSDPPFDVPGMTTVMLDSKGQLIQFVRHPSAVEDSPARSTQWLAFFEAAGLDQRRFRPASQDWISPVDHDTKYTWTGTQSVPVEVRAATLKDRPVFFETAVRMPAGSTPRRLPGTHATATEEFTGVAGFAAVFLGGLIFAAIVARRNIRLGRGDRAAARKLSIVVFASLLIAGLLSADHTPDLGGEWGLLIGIAGNALYHAGAIWLFYLAAEPYVRRRQPELLISWNRMLRGYFRDPLVARDVLIGSILGPLLHLFYGQLLVLVPAWLGMTPPLPNYAFPEKLGGGVWPLVSLASLLGGVPRDAVLALLIFCAFRSIVRNDWIPASFLTLIAAVPYLDRDMAPRIEVPFVICSAAVFVFALCRVGLLAGTVALFVGSWFAKSVFIFDVRSWLFASSLFYLGVTFAIAYYGFRYSVGEKPLLGPVRLAD